MSNSEKTTSLNDQFRKSLHKKYGKVFVTKSVLALDNDTLFHILYEIRNFENWTDENDPYGEHDFGRVTVNEQDYFWKIDYYNKNMTARSEDPADTSVTLRVMTIMKVTEY